MICVKHILDIQNQYIGKYRKSHTCKKCGEPLRHSEDKKSWIERK